MSFVVKLRKRGTGVGREEDSMMVSTYSLLNNQIALDSWIFAHFVSEQFHQYHHLFNTRRLVQSVGRTGPVDLFHPVV